MPASVIGYEASNSIVELSTTELDKLSYYVLEYMINSGDFAGTLTANTASTGNLIGTFVDTARVGNVGDSNITIVSNSTNLYQSNTQIFTTIPSAMTVGLNTAPITSVILEENKTPISALGQEIFDRYMNNGPGTYYLGVNAPVDGGTWGYDYYIDDTLFNFTTLNARYYLWKKLDQNYTGTHIEPLKLSGNVLTRFSDVEIKQLAYYVENIFLTTGISTYAFQTSPPATGSWVNQGTITDIRRVVVNEDFEGPAYASEYISTYDGIRELAYASPATVFSGYVGFQSFTNPNPDAVYYTSSFSASFTGEFSGIFSGPGGNYARTYAGVFIYTGLASPATDYIISFAGPTPYEGPLYTAPTFTGNYSSNYVGPDLTSYLSAAEYDGVLVALTNYDGFDQVVYAGLETLYAGVYTGPGSEVFDTTYTANFDDTVNTYETSYDTVFAGDYDLGTSPYVAEFITTVPETFDGTTFIGFNTFSTATGFTGFTTFTNIDGTTFSDTYTGNFTSSFAGYQRNYVENQVVNYQGPATYNFPNSYIGLVNYISPASYTASFIGLYDGNFESSYIATYTGDYDVSYLADYVATFTSDYTTSYLSGFTEYVGTVPAVYEGDSTLDYVGGTPGFASYDVDYQALNLGPLYTTGYVGPSFTGFDSTFVSEFSNLYTGPPVVASATETITSLTLWRRVA